MRVIRYKTKATKDIYHIVNTASLDVIQAHYISKNELLGVMFRKTYKTLRGAMKGLKESESIIWEKAMKF